MTKRTQQIVQDGRKRVFYKHQEEEKTSGKLKLIQMLRERKNKKPNYAFDKIRRYATQFAMCVRIFSPTLISYQSKRKCCDDGARTRGKKYQKMPALIWEGTFATSKIDRYTNIQANNKRK